MGSSMDDDETRVQRRENPLNTYATASRLLAEDALAGTATIQLGASTEASRFLPPARTRFGIYSAGTLTIMD